MHDRIDFTVKKYEKYIDMVPDSTMKLMFSTLPLLKFYVASKKNIHSRTRTNNPKIYMEQQETSTSHSNLEKQDHSNQTS